MPRKTKTKAKKEMMEMHGGCCSHSRNRNWHGGEMGSVYGLGFIGALVYYIQAATGFWSGVLGVLKAVVWPAFLIYKLLGM